jgi:acyl phosphate:glycerol-3-phosphate acyltransferase
MLIGVGYFIGSIPVGVLVGHAFGFDPRAVGSGNVGMTNVARAGGRAAAVITFVGDVLKGLIPVVLARSAGFPPAGLAAVGFAAFLGSIASIFLRFTGGRGVATSLGIWLALAPIPVAIAGGVFVALIAVSRIVSLASMGAAVALIPAAIAWGCPRPYVVLALAISSLVVLRHRANIGRLMAGEEPRIGERKSKSSP